MAGVGGWKYWVREWVGLESRPFTSGGWRRSFDFSTGHKVIGVQYIVTFIGLLLLSGLVAIPIRFELETDGPQLFDEDTCNTAMSLHDIMGAQCPWRS